ncbi:MAG: hypothetical protein A3F09_04390 [Chlamydiae bacterium RIFCSPHIGHO2_12_FULL_49_11]|nr:MAG: hypothetical protein A3F09_04390 [Chlamydiae bacterium RIFCSPHIGHO2_12_FULL_49_11]
MLQYRLRQYLVHLLMKQTHPNPKFLMLFSSSASLRLAWLSLTYTIKFSGNFRTILKNNTSNSLKIGSLKISSCVCVCKNSKAILASRTVVKVNGFDIVENDK